MLTRILYGQWTRVVFLLVIGIALLIFSRTTLFYKPEANGIKSFYYDVFIPISESIALAILSGGFFAFLLKSFQYIGVFREEVRSIFTSEDVLAHNKNGLRNLIFCRDSLTYSTLEFKETIWKNVTASIYESPLSDIDNEVVSTIYEKYIPKKLEYYQRDFMVSYEVNKVDDRHVELIENQSYYIVSKTDKFTLEKIYNVWREDDPEDKSLLEFSEIEVDNVSYISDVKNNDEISKTEKGKNFKVKTASFSREFVGNKVYKVRCRLRTIHSTQINVYWRYALGKFTKGITINVNYNPRDYSVGLEFFGKSIELEDNFVHLPSVSKRYNGLLMPSDSLMLVINPLKT